MVSFEPAVSPAYNDTALTKMLRKLVAYTEATVVKVRFRLLLTSATFLKHKIDRAPPLCLRAVRFQTENGRP